MNISKKMKVKEKGKTIHQMNQIAELSGVTTWNRAEDFWRYDNFTSL